MKSHKKLLNALKWFICCTFFIWAIFMMQGAGCTHWDLQLDGDVIIDESITPPEGSKLYLLFVNNYHKDCNPTLTTCEYHPYIYQLNKDEQTSRITEGINQYPISVEISTDVFYEADIIVFVELNDNKKLDEGEPYGTYDKAPLIRDAESTAIPITITIDTTR